MPPPSKSSLGPTRQRGVVTILTASVLMLLLLVMALALDTGRLYLEKRKLQNIADMSALSASARMPPGACSDASVLPDALSAAEKNGFPGIGGVWSLEVSCENRRVAVTAIHDAPISLVLGGIGTTLLKAHATAQHDEPVAAFTVGSQLLNLDSDRLIGQLLKGIGLDVSMLSVLDENGLANVSTTPHGLLQALGVEVSIDELAVLSPSGLFELVNTQVGALGIKELIDASLDLVSDETLDTQLSLLGDEIVSSPILGSVGLHLLDIIQLAAGDDAIGRSALETDINLSDLLGISLLTGLHEGGALDLDLELLGISDLNLAKLEVSIVEPPTMAIGPVGTLAKSAQLDLKLQVLSLPYISLLDVNLGLASGTSTLDSISCQAEPISPPEATFLVTSDPVTACLGVLGSNCNNQGNYIHTHTSPLAEKQSETVGSPMGLNLSGLLGNVVRNLPLLGPVLALLGLDRLVALILSPLDLVLSPVLSLLGLELGNIEVSVESISCGVPTLVE